MMTTSLLSSAALIQPADLLNSMDDPSLQVVDCWRSDAYARAHIPDAVHIGRDYWLKQPAPDGGPRGRFLEDEETLSDLFGSLGIEAGRTAVVYDDNGGRAAARIWWVLHYLGHENVLVLDGGWHGWMDAGGAVSYEVPAIRPARFQANLQPQRLATDREVLEATSGTAQLVDVRSAAEWDGSDLHGNRRGGHIPSATRLEWSDLLTAERPWHFRSPEEILATVRAAGIDPRRPIITYCQGGVRAAHAAFALELAGCPVRVYDASMEEWANRTDTELLTGPAESA
jgi:thiosulfate/3-mercaptopyruvate sulfurtransferase